MEMSLPPHFATDTVLSLHHMLRGPSIDFCDRISMVIKDCKGNHQKARVRARGFVLLQLCSTPRPPIQAGRGCDNTLLCPVRQRWPGEESGVDREDRIM